MSLFEFLNRVGYLLCLVVAPTSFTPEPTGAVEPAFVLAGLAGTLGLPLLGLLLARSYRSRESLIFGVLSFVAPAALVFAALRTTTQPLLGQYYVAAPPIWACFAGLAAALAGEHLGVSFRNKRMGAAIITLAIGIFSFRSANVLVASTEKQWAAVLAARPADERALTVLLPTFASDTKRRDEVLAACLARTPDSCLCRLSRAEQATRDRHGKIALGELHAASCEATDLRVIRVRAVALALSGEVAAAAQFIEPLIGPQEQDTSLRYALALLRDRQGQVDESLVLARGLTAADPKFFDAALLEASLLIKKGELGPATNILERLAKERPEDADVAYDLALCADRQGHFNPAREGYLKALRLRPTFREARYNLALLTLRHGATAEARNHAKKFIEQFPEDPRSTELTAQIQFGN